MLRWSGSRFLPARSCARSPASATSALISGAPWSPTRWSASTSLRIGSASIRKSTMTRPWPAVTEAVDGYPGIYRDVQTYLRERIKEVLTGSSESIVVRIFGEELDVLRKQAARVKEALTGIEGMVDLHEEPQKEIPQIQITVDLAKAAQFGLKPGDVRRAAAVVFAGEEVSDIHRNSKVYRRDGVVDPGGAP